MVSSLKHNTYNAYIRIHIHMHIINDDRGCLPDTGLRMLCKCKNVNARIRHLKDQVLYPCYIQLLMLKCGNITNRISQGVTTVMYWDYVQYTILLIK